MDKEHVDAYQKDCESSGNLDYPLAGCILTPLCKICKNYTPKYGTWEPSTCSLFGEIPFDVINCKVYQCDGFDHDPESSFNREFTKNLKPERK